ncbi:1-aminocyclopropane-1-carboxylate deaminase/D-cysteine desulfhydrase [Olivibacter sp. XZL3]|uniref:1-aminocyclopropane-1-carboxylate deaminase/D-cysteine desulfhydrase n=1 Tax=Olivibacter sp. XZL3 TaxID=1735116 RepID=UPI001065E235|nr:pyridoxal-phosphate dependent enzyme [Olivibacter sp. XZL3]
MFSFNFFSPTERLRYEPFARHHCTVDMKRDDLIHPFISGNKWRKLKYILEHAHKSGRNHLVTFGGAWSNHLLATAAAAATFGFKATGFVRGEPVDNPNLKLCQLFGMQLRYVTRDDYRNKQHLFNSHYGKDERAYFIDEGGASELALQGCAEIIDELDTDYDHIFCACGTGTTLAGLSMGLKQRNSPTKLHGVSVLAGGDFLLKDIKELYSAADNIVIHTAYHFGGYAKTKPPLIDFVKSFVSATGVLIEPVYTAKTFYALKDLMENNYFEPGARILVVHTGGLTGVLGKLDIF